jgi:hypothetical protein
MDSREFLEIYGIKDAPDWAKTVGLWVKGDKKIIVGHSDLHHDNITDNPREFLDDKTIKEFCEAYHLESIESLKDDWKFQHEMGEVHDELINLVLRNGWIRARCGREMAEIACYDLTKEKYRKAMADFLIDYSDAIEASQMIFCHDYIGHKVPPGDFQLVLNDVLEGNID